MNDDFTIMSHESHGQCFCCDSHCGGGIDCEGGCPPVTTESETRKACACCGGEYGHSTSCVEVTPEESE